MAHSDGTSHPARRRLRALIHSFLRPAFCAGVYGVSHEIQHATATTSAAVGVDGVREFVLREKFATAPDSKILRFELPKGQSLDRPAPSGVKVVLNTTNEDGLQAVLDKSYSPVSLPGAAGYFDLLVKAYAKRPGGGFGAYLCDMNPGDVVTMKIKAPREIHGSVEVARRWKRLGFVAGGTGVAPFIQIIRALLADPADSTELFLLSVNRHEEDILMRAELEELAATATPIGRLRITYALTAPGESWEGAKGRGSPELALKALPPPSNGDGTTMVLICGRDGFVETWAGGIIKVKDAQGKKQKAQGPLLGFLKAAGYNETEVYKF